MAEEIFRSRKPINMNSGSHQNTGVDKAQEIKSMQEAAQNRTSAPATNFDVPEVEIKGNMPPEMEAILNSGKPQPVASAPAQSAPRAKMIQDPSVQIANNSSLVDKLINNINSNLWFDVKLPSLGKFYNGQDGPSDGIIHLRQMTGEEEQILATPRFTKSNQALNMIFDRCMQEKYNSQKFLNVDRTYILIFLRGISYGTDYDVEVTSPLSNNKISTTINLDTLLVDYCPDDFGPQSLTGVMPKTGYKFKYRLPVGEDDVKTNKHKEHMAKFDRSNLADDTAIYRLALLTEEIEGVTNEHDIIRLLKALPTGDLTELRNCINNPPFGVNTKVEVVEDPAGDFTIELPIEADFFFPRKKKGR